MNHDNIPHAPTSLAWAVNRKLAPPTSVDLRPIFSSLEQERGIALRLSWTGVEATRYGETVYRDGDYSAVGASTSAQKARYKCRTIRFLRWALENEPTDELKKARGWLNAAF